MKRNNAVFLAPSRPRRAFLRHMPRSGSLLISRDVSRETFRSSLEETARRNALLALPNEVVYKASTATKDNVF